MSETMGDSEIKQLEKIGKTAVADLKKEENPKITIPLRGLSNVYFDKKEKVIRLGDKTSQRTLLNVAHTKKFMQTTMIAALCKRLLKAQKHASLREAYYQLKHSVGDGHENTFEGQEESDPLIEDMETLLHVLREKLHLSADRRGYLYGNIQLEDRGDIIDCSKLGSGGFGIPSTIEEIKFKKVTANYVLVIETAAMFERLIEEKFAQKNKAILVATQGQAARGCRRLINRLANEAKLPIYVFTDGDPYGYYIYSVIKQGSINLAYLSDQFGTPACRFLGMQMSDIKKYKLEKVTEKLKDLDRKRLEEELKYQWFQTPEWQKELNMMLTMGVRIEQQALAHKSLEFVAEEYLPEKIEKEDVLP